MGKRTDTIAFDSIMRGLRQAKEHQDGAKVYPSRKHKQKRNKVKP